MGVVNNTLLCFTFNTHSIDTMETALKAFFSSPRFAVAGASSGECLINVDYRPSTPNTQAI